ncbi:hypothetical protein PENANT_c310G02170 [Penicillium antarcticum]|uniref:Uncharacterized protein n=1 Tax=Penicillium antarcticum TaxID=416450 RepID=A0A1V6NUT1_9EURO|nr:hypothetical protein PENANT_c310G02170 [Penicillium antarcticum]
MPKAPIPGLTASSSSLPPVSTNGPRPPFPLLYFPLLDLYYMQKGSPANFDGRQNFPPKQLSVAASPNPTIAPPRASHGASRGSRRNPLEGYHNINFTAETIKDLDRSASRLARAIGLDTTYYLYRLFSHNPNFSVKSAQNNKAIPPQLIGTIAAKRAAPTASNAEETRISTLENALATLTQSARDDTDLDNPHSLDSSPAKAISD